MTNNDIDLEKFVFYRLVKTAYILTLLFCFFYILHLGYRILWDPNINYNESNLKCYNGKTHSLCCDPFLYVEKRNFELDKKSDFLARQICASSAENTTNITPPLEKNYRLELKYVPKTPDWLEKLFNIIMTLVLITVCYVFVNIAREALLYIVYGKSFYWGWLRKIRILS